ncbi:MAG: hypothetical protein ACJAS1_002441 [Oleiphilaceae bacterium]
MEIGLEIYSLSYELTYAAGAYLAIDIDIENHQ